MALVAVIPEMTSNNSPAPFVATASSVYPPLSGYEFDAWHSFNSDNVQWYGGNKTNQYLQIDLGSPRKIAGYRIIGTTVFTATIIKTWRLRASNDGSSWTTVHNGTSGSSGDTLYQLNLGTYRYWRVDYLTDNGVNPWATIGRFQLYEEGVLDSDRDGVPDSKDYYPNNPSKWQPPSPPVTRWSYDFSFLTSPRDARLDGWIGQTFPLSYLNSELGTNFVFRFRPFGSSGGRFEHRIKMADRDNTSQGITQDSFPRSVRSNPDMSAMKIDTPQFSWRWSHNAIISRAFSLALTETTALLDIFRLWASTEIEADTVDGYVGSHRTNEEHTNFVLDYYNIKGQRRQDMRHALQVIEDYVRSNRRIAGTVTSYYDLFNLVDPQLETIVIGKLITSYIEKYRNGVDFSELIITNKHEKNSISESWLVLSSSRENIGVSITDTILVDTTENDAIKNVYVNASGQEYRDSVIQTMSNADADDNIGVIYDYPLNADPFLKEGVNTHISLSVKNSTENIATILENLLVDKYISKNALFTEHLVIDEINANIGVHYSDIVRAESNPNKDVFVLELQALDKQIKENEAARVEIMYIDKNDREAIEVDYTEIIEILNSEAHVEDVLVNISLNPIEGLVVEPDLELFEKTSEQSIIEWTRSIVEKLEKDATIQAFIDEMTMVDKGLYDSTVDENVVRAEIIGKEKSTEGFIVREMVLVTNALRDSRTDREDVKVDPAYQDASIDFVDKALSMLPKNANELDVFEKRVNKLEAEALLQFALQTVTPLEKMSIIRDNWQAFMKYVPEGFMYTESATKEHAYLLEKIAKSADAIVDVTLVEKEWKDTYLNNLLLADTPLLDSYLMQMVGYADREEYWQDAIKSLVTLADNTSDEMLGTIETGTVSVKEDAVAIICELISAHDSYENNREAYIPKEQYVLSGDGSDWEDIWTRYSPGVDILDPPDADFDYSTLANTVYDLTTGVPKNPKGPTNLPDVKVPTPLHHPLPENYDLGVDDTKRLIVDNYIFIDTVLALESLKNRNTLRYAGMPAEKTMRELFSKLFTWIQQAAPGNAEYDRMFRFSRWYAESIVIQQSQHILHRVYNGWRSRYHMSEDLGLDYTEKNWKYFVSAQVAQTTGIHSEYKFKKENYIDGELILRGYFDNPLGQGTMSIRIDGIEVDTFKRNGSFTRTIEVPQGNHTYEFIFDGDTGRVSLSTIEISGTEFISAHTTSDDTDTNGLKASTLLINHLLAYFDKHHGGGKTKGTMEIRQRGIWNTHT